MILRKGEEPLTDYIPSDVYIVTTQCMSGDGYEYSDRTIQFKSTEEGLLKDFLKILQIFYSLSWNEGCDEELLMKTISAYSNTAWDRYTEYVGWDVTSDYNRHRSPCYTSVEYIDSDHVRYPITILDDDCNPIKMRR